MAYYRAVGEYAKALKQKWLTIADANFGHG